MNEGYIKFNCNWIKGEPVSIQTLSDINRWRDTLYNLGLIGTYKDGIGFGNISIRYSSNIFIISGSATGGLSNLNENHYVLVNEFNLAQNSLTCTGPIKASSESLTHAAIYVRSQETMAVIHIHSIAMWKKLIHKVPTTREDIEYGTPEMAYEIMRLCNNNSAQNKSIIVMGGHKEGIISFGKTLDEAGKLLLEQL